MATFTQFIAQLLFFGLLFFVANKFWNKYRGSRLAATGAPAAFVTVVQTIGGYTGGIVWTAAAVTAGLKATGWLDNLPWLDIIKLICQMFGGCA